MERLSNGEQPVSWEPPHLDELFPTKGAIPEALQIGRGGTIAELTDWFVQGEDVLTIQERRIGKTSTIGHGALLRLRGDYEGVIAQADLRLASIRSATDLAEALLNSAIETGAGRALHTETAGLIASRTQRFLRSARVKAAAQLTEENAKLRTLQAVATLVVGDRPSSVELLRKVLEALEHEAATHQRPVVAFIDEVQDLGDPKRWEPEEGMAVQRELERAMRLPGRLVTYAYAGSEETAMEKVFAQGQPLYFESQRYVLPPIDREAWLSGLRERFARDRRTITTKHLDRILNASGGHPLRTMQVCRAALRTARQQQSNEISGPIVEEAIAQAKAHPSWREPA